MNIGSNQSDILFVCLPLTAIMRFFSFILSLIDSCFLWVGLIVVSCWSNAQYDDRSQLYVSFSLCLTLARSFFCHLCFCFVVAISFCACFFFCHLMGHIVIKIQGELARISEARKKADCCFAWRVRWFARQ